MLLTDAQIHAIRQIIQDHHTAFIANYISPEAVAPEILEKLKAKGLVNVKIKSIEDAYVYGILVAMMDDPKVKSMNVEQFKDYIRSHPVPLSEIEKRAVAMAQHQAAQYVVGLGNRVNQATGQLLIEADADLRAKLQTEIRDKTAENIERRESVEQLKSDLGWVSKDWARDWNRIAVTEKHNAMQAGVRDHLRDRWGKDALVAKIPMPDACFVGGTPVLTRGGWRPIESIVVGQEVLTHKLRWRRVIHTFRNSYDGKIIGFNGRSPCVTVNHPMLAGLNWQRADTIQRGDDLIGVAVRVAQDDPSLIMQTTFFENISGANSSPSVPISPVQLYRYLQMRDSDVNIKFVNGEFEHRGEYMQLGGQSDCFRGSPCKIALAGQSVSTTAFGLHGLVSRLTGIFSKCVSFCFGHASHTGSLAFGLAGYGNFPFTESTFNGAPTDREIASNRLQRMFMRVPKFNQFGLGNVFPRIHEYTIYPITERVNRSVTANFKGMVYNLKVADDASYIAEGLIVHNCEHCKRLYLGPDGMPRIFKLSVLEKHGHTNFGRKVGDWQAVTGSTHPWCQCQLVHIPPGWGFNEEGQLEPGGQLGVNYGSKEDLQMAMLREADLRKAGATRATNYAGIPIVVEQEPGSTRKWKTPEGDSGETVMQYIYGYIPATNGADDEGIDVFVGTDPNAPMAYIINQQNPETGRYDEDKVMLGFETETAARNAYRAHYDSGEFFAGITPITIDQFKRVARSTSPKEPTLFKAGQPMMPLVVPLRKGEGQTDQTPAATSQALDRSPSPGTAANHIFRVPPRPVAVDMAQTARDVIDSQKLQNQAFKRDKKIYTIHNAIRIVRPIGKPVMESGLDPEQIKMNRERLLEAGEARQAGRAINRVEIGGDDADTADDDTED